MYLFSIYIYNTWHHNESQISKRPSGRVIFGAMPPRAATICLSPRTPEVAPDVSASVPASASGIGASSATQEPAEPEDLTDRQVEKGRAEGRAVGRVEERVDRRVAPTCKKQKRIDVLVFLT